MKTTLAIFLTFLLSTLAQAQDYFTHGKNIGELNQTYISVALQSRGLSKKVDILIDIGTGVWADLRDANGKEVTNITGIIQLLNLFADRYGFRLAITYTSRGSFGGEPLVWYLLERKERP